MAAPFIRPFNSTTDIDAGLHVFLSTIDKSVDYEPARTIGSYLWYRAYVYLTPSTCFVLDDGTGRAVGYIIGTSDTASFIERWKTTFTPTLDPKVVPPPGVQTDDPAMETEFVKELRKEAYRGECSMLQTHELLKEYPAHLHIDILSEFTGKGWGAKMMGEFLEGIKGAGAQGVHLGMVRTNDGARRFYERVGFGICEQVLDGGASGETGRLVDGICLVKKL